MRIRELVDAIEPLRFFRDDQATTSRRLRAPGVP